MVTTVTDNSPQAINTSLFSLEKEIEALKQNIERIKASLNNLDIGVVSVNDKTGKVELTAEDVGALPSDTHIPTDPVQSNWAETDTSSLAYIENKPNLATVATSGSYNDLSDKPSIPAAQVNSDWNATSGVAEILNKPTIPTVVDTVADGNSNAVTSNAVYYKTLPLMGPRVNGPGCTSAELCNYIVNNGVATACCSSAQITDGPNGDAWYNFLYIPHRNGIGGDNYKYGTLLLFEMTRNSTWAWIKHLIGGAWYEWKTLIQG